MSFPGASFSAEFWDWAQEGMGMAGRSKDEWTMCPVHLCVPCGQHSAWHGATLHKCLLSAGQGAAIPLASQGALCPALSLAWHRDGQSTYQSPPPDWSYLRARKIIIATSQVLSRHIIIIPFDKETGTERLSGFLRSHS